MMAVFAALVWSGCSAQDSAPPPAPLSISGFSSRQTAGEDPQFDVTAGRAWMMASSEDMVIQNVRFRLFRDGRPVGRASADTGFFYPELKNVELYGGVTYDADDDSLHIRSERMAWDSKTSILRCDTAVRGTLGAFSFSADQLDISRISRPAASSAGVSDADRTRSVMLLRNATFMGPG
ncbi:LPS export ABC transporter periplasmic protein LptC [bacterium]|nr:LPS export ABC transporter periplasmic protein LptC [bacterium]